jgi:hypothetical protein
MESGNSIVKYQIDDYKQVQQFSTELASFVERSKLTVAIQGNKYVNVEGWQFAASNFGIMFEVDEVIRLSDPYDKILIYYEEVKMKRGQKTWKEDRPYHMSVLQPGQTELPPIDKARHKRDVIKPFYSYRARCVLRNTEGQMIGSGVATCSNMESKKRDFDEYSVASMAQTRATGKAMRLKFGFVFKLAGYATTPAEEMAEFQDLQSEAAASQPRKRKVTAKAWKEAIEKYKQGDVSYEDITSLIELTEEQRSELDKLSN